MALQLSRRELLRTAAVGAAVLTLPAPLRALMAATADPHGEDRARLAAWVAELRAAGLARPGSPAGVAVARVGELAVGTPYEAFTLEAYLRAGGDPTRTEPLTLWLTRFDCVSLVESCVAIARLAREPGVVGWEGFGREMERLRYRHGVRGAYGSRLHYFSEWIRDNAARGGLDDLGRALGAEVDARPLRFMSANRNAYPALANQVVFEEIAEMERELDDHPRWVVPTDRIDHVADGLETGDIVAFATSIPGLDVTHAAFAYRVEGAPRVLHAPLAGGVVEVTEQTLTEYTRAIRRSTGILVARPSLGHDLVQSQPSRVQERDP